MAEFCSCGSLKIGGNCTNKNCANKVAAKPASRAKSGKAAGSAAKAVKTLTPEQIQAKARRASKCITYNLYDIEKPENNNEEEEDQ